MPACLLFSHKHLRSESCPCVRSRVGTQASLKVKDADEGHTRLRV